MGEVRYENAFFDGMKIEANTNRYTFVWKKVIEKNEMPTEKAVQNAINSFSFAS